MLKFFEEKLQASSYKKYSFTFLTGNLGLTACKFYIFLAVLITFTPLKRAVDEPCETALDCAG